jgi:hypothetical protein
MIRPIVIANGYRLAYHGGWIRVNCMVKDIDEELSKIGLIVRFEGVAVGWTTIPIAVALLVTVILIM